jgi:Glyoxalase-like domain
MHIDVALDELAAAVAGAIDLGATLAGFQSSENVRVLIDPAGQSLLPVPAHITRNQQGIQASRRRAVNRQPTYDSGH